MAALDEPGVLGVGMRHHHDSELLVLGMLVAVLSAAASNGVVEARAERLLARCGVELDDLVERETEVLVLEEQGLKLGRLVHRRRRRGDLADRHPACMSALSQAARAGWRAGLGRLKVGRWQR